MSFRYLFRAWIAAVLGLTILILLWGFWALIRLTFKRVWRLSS